ncbi:MAG TPA: DUF1343 domain-containing protein [Bacteroidetes bacterium]|nr:DUF1343 domain-containing protein [Bacteroidota bacterium]
MVPGAYSTAKYIPLLKNKNVALVVNHSSELNGTHLLDTLLNLEVKVLKIFAPEHGFRGKADAGEVITDGIDSKTGIRVVSLYGKKRKPDTEDLKDIDVIVFDIQDVGVRFYTYISTMAYTMEAAAEKGIPFLVLDRPNPNAYLIDGPVLNEKFKSFVGMFPIPVSYGMTIGELAKMIKGEKWMNSMDNLELKVVPVKNYTHDRFYDLPVKPSPNLPDSTAVMLYPSLCFFEGTSVSVGRGTDKPFKQIGHPDLKEYYDYFFIPQPNEGAHNPKLKGQKCYGIDLSKTKIKDFRYKNKLELGWLIDFYNKLKGKGQFFNKNNGIDRLAGTDELRKMIIEGKSEEEIRASWKKDLDNFKIKRAKYLIYD